MFIPHTKNQIFEKKIFFIRFFERLKYVLSVADGTSRTELLSKSNFLQDNWLIYYSTNFCMLFVLKHQYGIWFFWKITLWMIFFNIDLKVLAMSRTDLNKWGLGSVWSVCTLMGMFFFVICLLISYITTYFWFKIHHHKFFLCKIKTFNEYRGWNVADGKCVYFIFQQGYW